MILATVTALVLIAIAARVVLEPSENGEDPPVAEENGKNQEGDPVVPADAPPVEGGQGGDIANDAVDRRLEHLGDRLDQYAESRSEFPAGAFSTGDLPIPQRFSWLATLDGLRDGEADAPHAKFDRPWNDPLNDRFVRRRIVEFQNPQIVELAGEDGYPATHFVGLAGIGPEALRANAPPEIVGMFPLDRGIKLTDVRDGLSQTILVCGVTRHLGAWAAAGPATVRAVTGNPIVGGPDGFGTGDADGMFVLMADGRVDRISADIDPAVFRRLVAIADEATTTPAGPPIESVGEDGTANEPSADVAEEVPHKADTDVEMADKEERSDLPAPTVDEEEAPPERKIDITEALAVPILRFEQASKKRSVALLGVEEMLGVPIRYDREGLGPAAEALDGKVTLSLRKTTVAGILDGILSSTGLAYHVEADHIAITSKP
ncbi:MAG: DUF1559 domain-containing protein [Planctomycetota bacterium]|nr:DUF1559 domain-containing protein [Planctomycetota bacterium]